MDLSLVSNAISTVQSSAFLPSAAPSFASTGYHSISSISTASDAFASSLLGTLNVEPLQGPWFDVQLPLINTRDDFPQSWTAHYRPLLDARLLKLEGLLKTGPKKDFVNTFQGTYEEAAHVLARRDGGQAYAEYFDKLRDLLELVNLGSNGISLRNALDRLEKLADDTDKAVEARRYPQMTEMPTPTADRAIAQGVNIGGMVLGMAAGVGLQ